VCSCFDVCWSFGVAGLGLYPCSRLIERLTEIGRYYGMEVNMEKTKAMRILRQPSPIQITIDHKQPENVEYFNCWVAC